MKWDFIRVSGTALPPFEKFREARGARQTTSRDKKVSRDLKHPQDRGFRAAYDGASKYPRESVLTSRAIRRVLISALLIGPRRVTWYVIFRTGLRFCASWRRTFSFAHRSRKIWIVVTTDVLSRSLGTVWDFRLRAGHGIIYQETLIIRVASNKDLTRNRALLMPC